MKRCTGECVDVKNSSFFLMSASGLKVHNLNINSDDMDIGGVTADRLIISAL